MDVGVWTTGGHRRGNGMWITYWGHKIWITTRIANSNWWRNPRGMWIVYLGQWVWTTDDLEEGQVCG